MPEHDYSKDKLIQFLRESTLRGLLNPAVAKSRLNAIEQLFVELTEQEAQDLRILDLEQLCARFHKLHDSSIRPEVLSLYQKRLNAALVDYFAWLNDPKSFFSVGGDSIRKDKIYQPSSAEQAFEDKALEEITLATSEAKNDIFSIPLRPDLTIYIKNLPLDLTLQEATKIGRVVSALVQESSQESVKQSARAKNHE